MQTRSHCNTIPLMDHYDVIVVGAGIGGLWLVGDSTFPGQSTAAVTQSGIRVYQAIRRESKRAGA